MIPCYKRPKRGRRDKLKRNGGGWRIGEDHHNAKISDEDVELMRKLWDEGLTGPEIAEKFEVNVNTVYGIVRYQSRTGVLDL